MPLIKPLTRPMKTPLFETGGSSTHLRWVPEYQDYCGTWLRFAGVTPFKTREACKRWIAELTQRAEKSGIALMSMRSEPIVSVR